MLWVILFFYFGVLSLRDFIRWCQLGGLWALTALHGSFALIGFMLHQFELARLIGIRPYNAITFSGPIAVFVASFSSTLWVNQLVFRSIFWGRRYLRFLLSSRFPHGP